MNGTEKKKVIVEFLLDKISENAWARHNIIKSNIKYADEKKPEFWDNKENLRHEYEVAAREFYTIWSDLIDLKEVIEDEEGNYTSECDC